MHSLTSSRYVALIAALFLLCLSYNHAQAAPGSLDRTFGSGGKVTTPVGGGTDFASGVAIQPDGKIVVAGSSANGSADDFALVRYNANGTLDTTFGGTGKVTTPIGIGDGGRAFAVAIQPDGKIVAAGSSSNGSNPDITVIRYNPDGTLDTTFNGTGKVSTPIGSDDDTARAVTIQPDGKIVAVGYSYSGSHYDFALVRYNTNGTLDTSFNSTGKVTTQVGISGSVALGVAIQPDGKLIAAGFASNPTADFAVVRYNVNGTLDTTFNGTGKVTTAIGSGDDEAFAVALQPDGKIVAVGESVISSNNNFALARYNTNGTLDTTFNGTGKVTTVIGSNGTDLALAAAIQPNGKIVAAGYSSSGTLNNDFALARYNANGTLDTSFSGTGKVKTAIGSNSEQAHAVAIQPDGRIVAAGESITTSNYDFAVVRYQGDTTAVPGNPDMSFNGTGKAITSFSADQDLALAVAIQPDGKIVTAGASRNVTDDFALVRYNADGTLDTSFNGTGKVTTSIGSSDDAATAVVIQPDGKIVAAGHSYSPTDSFALVRYNANGTLDTSFNGTGIVTTDISIGTDDAHAIAIQSDGKIVVAGYSASEPDFDFDVALVRYNINGTLDTTFGGTGKVTTDFGGGDDYGLAVALQPGGKIIVAGFSQNGANYDFALMRYNTNGSLDTSFNGTGKVTTAIGSGDDYGLAVVIQPDGQIVVAGYCDNGSNYDFALARYNSNGTPDTTFNGTGKVTTAVGSNDDFARAVAIQPDSKIVAGGYSTNDNRDYFALARYNTNGSLDTSFGEGGTIRHDVSGIYDAAYAMAIQPNGRIILAGASTNATDFQFDFVVARYYTDMHARSDFDGDNRSDIAMWNPNNGNWYIRQSQSNTDRAPINWGSGALGDIAVPRDYDGDNKTDLAVWRPGDGNFYIIKSTTGLGSAQSWGGSGDIPVPADYDGDGKADLAVFRPSEGNWYIVNSSTNTVTVRGWGASTDKPVPGDYDGDGKTDIAVYRPSEGNWYIINSSTNTLTLKLWGNATDNPVPADYDGDGKTDIAVFRGPEGTWHIINSVNNTVTVKNWGSSALGDITVPADYDLDGKADIAVFRPAEGNWYIINSSTGAVNLLNFGSFSDVPAPATYLPQ